MTKDLNLSDNFAAEFESRKELARKLFKPYKTKTGNLIIRTPHLSEEEMNAILQLLEDLRWNNPLHSQKDRDVIIMAGELVFLMMDQEIMVCNDEQKAVIEELLSKKERQLEIRITADNLDFPSAEL